MKYSEVFESGAGIFCTGYEAGETMQVFVEQIRIWSRDKIMKLQNCSVQRGQSYPFLFVTNKN